MRCPGQPMTAHLGHRLTVRSVVVWPSALIGVALLISAGRNLLAASVAGSVLAFGVASLRPSTPSSQLPIDAPAFALSSSDAWRLAAVAPLIACVIAFDANRLIGTSALKYFFPLLLFAVTLPSLRLSAGARWAVRGEDRFLAALCAFGLAGSIYGAFIAREAAPWFVFFAPLTAALAAPMYGAARLTASAARILERSLAWAGMLYLSSLPLSWVLPLPLAGPGVYRHESAILLLLPLLSFGLRREWKLFLCATGLSLFAIAHYPAATYPLVLLVGGVTIVSVRYLTTRLARAVMVVMVGFVALFLGHAFLSGSAPLDSYFEAVDKTDNSATRRVLWSDAWDDFIQSPIYGTAFTGAYPIPVSSAYIAQVPLVPVHNELLALARSGGILAVTLALAWAFCVNRSALSALGPQSGLDPEVARLGLVVLSALMAQFASALFNPVFGKVEIATVAMLSYLILRLVINSTAQSVDGPQPGNRYLRVPTVGT